MDENCSCAACRRSRGYLRLLFTAKEMLGPILLWLHNITYHQRLLADACKAIERRRFEEFAAEKYAGWAPPYDSLVGRRRPERQLPWGRLLKACASLALVS
jgi:queuine/archaeosine tRNA-ribosyltransferase